MRWTGSRSVAFAKHVDDVIFSSQSTATVQAQQFYALLQRRARSSKRRSSPSPRSSHTDTPSPH
jgi:hypothetical protein